MCFSSFDGRDEEGILDSNGEATLDVPRDASSALRQMPTWLSNSTPDEFLV